MKFDVVLKSIFQDAMPGLLRLLGLPPAAEYLTVEFPERHRLQPDLLVRLADGRILHLELQSANDGAIHWRCLAYYAAIRAKWPGSTVVQVVLYLGQERLRMPSGIEEESLQFRFQTVDIKAVPAEAFLESEGDSERMLAALCASPDPRATIVRILASWRHLPDEQVRRLVGQLCTLSQMRKCETIVEEEHPMPIELDIMQNEVFKKQFAKHQAQAEARGEAIGEARGEARGEAKILARIIELRFGALPDSIKARLNLAGTEQLDCWAGKVISAQSVDEIFEA